MCYIAAVGEDTTAVTFRFWALKAVGVKGREGGVETRILIMGGREGRGGRGKRNGCIYGERGRST